MAGDPLKHRRWRELCARLREELPPTCHVCALPIDRSLHHYDRMSWTLDHVIPRKVRPDLAFEESNLRPAHRSCNGRKGAGLAPTPVVRSRIWG